MGNIANQLTAWKNRPAMGAAAGAVLLAALSVGPTGTALAGDGAPAQMAYAVPGPSPAIAPSYPTPFAQARLRGVDVAAFPKWHGALGRIGQQLRGAEPASGGMRQAHATFAHIVALVAAKSGLDMLSAANSLIDAVPYRSDRELYGVSDRWATPIEMLAANGGDCEDHAIAKLTVLRQAGFPDDRLRLTVGIDRETGKPHAMAVAELDGVSYALDGRTRSVVAWDVVSTRFRPLYATGFAKAWLYRS